MNSSPYRSLPVVQAVPASSCRDCKYVWTIADELVVCALATADWWCLDVPWQPPIDDGMCTQYRPTARVRFLVWLGLRKQPMRLEIVDGP